MYFLIITTACFPPAFSYQRTQRLHADMSFHGSEAVRHYLSIRRPWRMHQQTHLKFAGLLPLQSTLSSWHWQTDGGQTDQGCRKDSVRSSELHQQTKTHKRTDKHSLTLNTHKSYWITSLTIHNVWSIHTKGYQRI